MDVDSRQKNADDYEAGEVLKAREQASFLIYTPWATNLRMPKASRLILRRLFSPNGVLASGRLPKSRRRDHSPLGDKAGSTGGLPTPVPFFPRACPKQRPSRAVLMEHSPIRIAPQSLGCPILGQAAETVFHLCRSLDEVKETA